MVEAIVSMVLGKLCDVAVREVLFLYGVDDQVEAITRELGRIKCFLKDAENKRGSDERVKHWIGEVRDVAHRIEDAIDTFLVEVDGIVVDRGRKRKRGFLKFMEETFMKRSELPARRKLGKEINKIQKLIREIAESRSIYDIKGLDESGLVEVRQPIRKPAVPNADDTEVVGFEDDTKNIVNLLVDESTHRRTVTSIVGPGGLGKTTLALKAYKMGVDKGSFKFHTWLSISKEFTQIGVLKKIMKKLRDDDSKEYDQEEIISEIYNSLKNKKYLVVLDDVWTDDLWTQLQVTLPDVKNGSRVLITTRNKDVALAASPSKPYELRFLDEKESKELLLKKAFPYHEPNEPYPDELLDLTKKFCKKCGCLPLALVVVGGLLSRKLATYSAWNGVFRNMNWHGEGKQCMDILASSYNDLPAHLKPCFMYFACFPEDFVIREEFIIRLWVAEGFIQEGAHESMEKSAMNYLEELIQRCLLQTIETIQGIGFDSRNFRYLRIHDLLRDLAIHEAMEETNLTILSKEGAQQTTKGASRRATLQNCNLELMEYTGPNLRSVLCFNPSEFKPDYSAFRLLKVLNMMNLRFSDDAKLDWLKGLIHLKYLGLINCRKTPKLPEDIGYCRTLETLHVECIDYGHDFPESLWSIKALRHVIARSSFGFEHVTGPPASAELTNLLTLEVTEVHDSWMDGSLPRLTRLSTLALVKTNRISWDIIINLLCQLNHLINLKLKGDDFTREILDTSKFPIYEFIESMNLEGPWSESVSLDATMFPSHLTELVLVRSNLKQDPMPELEKLSSLRVLVLQCEVYIGNLMVCSAGGFLQLQQLTIWGLDELEDMRIEENSMPMLNTLVLAWCEKLQMLPDLHYVPTLRKLKLIYMPMHITTRVQSEDRHKTEHIPLIEID